MQIDRFERIHAFLNETLEYFLTRSESVDRDRYFADRDKRSILDKSINDIILAVVQDSRPHYLL